MLILFLATFLNAAEEFEKTALITGVTGQDGSYLSEFLLEKGYTVYGGVRRVSVPTTERIDEIKCDPKYVGKFHLVNLDVTDQANIISVLRKVQPDEIYNLAAMSFVETSFEQPSSTMAIDAMGPLYFLEAIRFLGFEHKVKFYQASTSELYGLVQEMPQTEMTPFYPRSPYAIAKQTAFWFVVNARERQDAPIFACNGILFNHESPRRGEEFVTRKITLGLARIKYGLQERLELGNLDSLRDWGHAKDYVRMQWMMLQQEKPEDYVIATGEQHSVREFVYEAALLMGINLHFEGTGIDEIAKDDSGKVWVSVNPKYFRPTEVQTLLGSPAKAREKLDWQPAISFDELVSEMVRFDLEKVQIESMRR